MRGRWIVRGLACWLLGGLLFGGAWALLPREPQRAGWAYWSIMVGNGTYKVRFTNQEGRLAKMSSHSSEHLDASYYVELGPRYFRDHPPGFEWLWGQVIVETRLELRQILKVEHPDFVWPDNAVEQLEALVVDDITNQRVEELNWSSSKAAFVLGIATPIQADPRAGTAVTPYPEMTVRSPAWSLPLVSVMTALSFASGVWGIGYFGQGLRGFVVRKRRTKRSVCLGCGYDLRGLSVCPECGSLDTSITTEIVP